MLARLRSFLLLTPVLVVLGLLIAWLLFGWFGFGPLAKWGAQKFVADKTGHVLTLDEPTFDPLRLQLTLPNLKLSEPNGKPLAGFKELFVDFEASSLFRMAWTFNDIRLTGPEGRLALLPGGKLNWTAFLASFKDEENEPEKDLPRLLIRHFELKDGRFDFADQTIQPAFETAFTPLELTLDDLSTLPDDKGAYQVSARTIFGAHLRWKGDVVLQPARSVTGAFSLDGIQLKQLAPYLKGRLAIAAPEGVAGFSTDYRVRYDKKNLSLNLDRMGASIDGLSLRGMKAAEPALALDKLRVTGGAFDLEKRTLNLAEIALIGGKVSLTRRTDGSVDIQDWFVAAPAPAEKAPALEAKTPSPEAKQSPWKIDLAHFNLDGIGIHVVDQTFAVPLALDVGNLRIGFKADASIGEGAPEAKLAGGEVRLDKLALASGGKPVFDLAGIGLEGIQASLAEQHAEVARLALERGKLAAVRAADGRIALLNAFKPAAPAKATPAKSDSPGWTWKLAQAELIDFQASVRDESVSPAGGLTLSDIDFSAAGLTENLNAAVPIRLAVKVKEGGNLHAQGKLVPAKGSVDTQVKLSALNLTPAQTYIARKANVVLASGAVGSQGRLKVGDRVSYQGGFSVANLLVNESETGNRVLAWKNLASDELTATPDAVDIGAVQVDGLGLKLVIHKDKSLNLVRLMKSSSLPEAEVSSPAPPDAVATRVETGGPPMKFAIERIDVLANELDFADESLAFPFATRVHQLKGAINGVSLDKGQPAQLEIDGRVDDYGLARAVGQIDFLDPTGFTDVKVVFRNVELNRLTPYSATFAGRKIDSGKLSLDLEYKIKQRQLAGENQIVMNKLTLGERVEAPGAKSLPLDLAIAILEDSEGVIDLDLPVSGSLDDPKFSYGGIIWKAIVNVVAKIALAPFRALGKLLGAGSEKLEHIVFDAGAADLLPPEREKLERLAGALAKRPGLALDATPAWNPEADRHAIKESRVRRALALAAGRKLAPGEDPGPVSTAQPATRAALEKVYAARIGVEALKTLRARLAQANPEPQPATTGGRLLARLSGMLKRSPEPLSAEEAERLKGADLHDLLYRALLDSESVTDAELLGLAGQRGEAIRQALLVRGVSAERVALRAPETVIGDMSEIPSRLGLGVASRTPAP